MKLVECPVCDSKFDIDKVPEGTKLKCGQCQKIFGVVKNGEMVPVGITQEGAKPTKVPKETVVSEQTVEGEKIAPRRPSTIRRKYATRIQQQVKPKPKPEPLLYVGALVALGAIATFFYVLSVVQTPPKNIDAGTQILKNNGPEKTVNPKEKEEKKTE